MPTGPGRGNRKQRLCDPWSSDPVPVLIVVVTAFRYRLRLRGALLVTLGSIAAGLSACGTSEQSNRVVARVQGVGAITEASLDHWARVEAVLVNDQIPTHPVPRGLVPDPPEYRACISYLRAVGSHLGVSGAVKTSTLETRCRGEERSLRESTLNTLISWEWTIGRGRALGIHVTDRQVQERLAEVVKNHSLYGSDFARYLRLTGQTRADLLRRSRVQLYEVALSNRSTELIKELPRSLTDKERQAAYATLLNRFTATRSWVSKTSCSAGFVVSACKQYKGPEPPPGSVD